MGSRRVLVTGAAGFVGRHALAALAAAGPDDRIVGIGRGQAEHLPPGVSFEPLDLLDAERLSAFVAAFRPTDILHLAGMAAVQHTVDALTETWRANVGGLLNLAEAVVRGGAGANFFFVSSGEVYGHAFLSGRPVDEAVEPRPGNSYALSKRIGEQILADILPAAGVFLMILRPFNHVGVGQDERFVVPSFAGQIARIEAGVVPPVLEVGDLSACRDFLPVGDVVRAYVDLMARTDSIPSGSVFNVASGRARSIASVLGDLRRHARTPFEVRAVPARMRPSQIPLAAGDAARLRQATGWAPCEDWEATLGAALDDARGRVAVSG